MALKGDVSVVGALYLGQLFETRLRTIPGPLMRIPIVLYVGTGLHEPTLRPA